MQDLPERDWKVLRRLLPAALDRYSERILEEVRLAATAQAPAHERYAAVNEIVCERERSIRRAFGDVRRSRAVGQILDLRALGLVASEDFDLFSEETRARILELETVFASAPR